MFISCFTAGAGDAAGAAAVASEPRQLTKSSGAIGIRPETRFIVDLPWAAAEQLPCLDGRWSEGAVSYRRRFVSAENFAARAELFAMTIEITCLRSRREADRLPGRAVQAS